MNRATLSPAPSSARAVPRGADLQIWTNRRWEEGLQVETLWAGDELVVQTAHSTYAVTVVDPRERAILVRGGRFFLERTRAWLDGASLGGSFLKIGGLYVGFSIEIRSDQGVVRTSRVRSIGMVQHG